MGKILVVAEKPSVGRDLARILKSRKKEDGYMDGSDYVVTWAIGHLAKLYDPGDYDQKFKRWSMGNLPLIPPRMKIKVDPKHKKQFDTVKMLMNSTQVASIICATDAGREGELIFRYIYELAGCKKPVERLWISSMVDEAIKKGFQSLRPGNEFDNLFIPHVAVPKPTGLSVSMLPVLSRCVWAICSRSAVCRHPHWPYWSSDRKRSTTSWHRITGKSVLITPVSAASGTITARK